MARSYLRQAEERVTHATDALARENYAYVIRPLKAALRLVGIEPPKFHDVGPLLREGMARISLIGSHENSIEWPRSREP
jgi:HEPN domain-containing protein